MLSSVQIHAAGQTGQEAFQLKINDEVKAEFRNVKGDIDSRSFLVFDYQTTDPLAASDIRIEFINDLWEPESGLDRNLLVDKIVVDGIQYETENPSTYSTGLYDHGLTGPGFLETEMLNVNGSFFYSDEGATPRFDGTRIRIDATGQEGGEHFQLLVDEQPVAQFFATDFATDYYFNTNPSVTIDQLRIEFLNDDYQPSLGYDRNLTISQIQLTDWASGENLHYSTNSPSVFSTGTWTAADGVMPGYDRGDTLHTNGYFQFATEFAPRSLDDVLEEFKQLHDPGVQILLDYRPETWTDNLGRQYKLAGAGQTNLNDKILVVRLTENGTKVDPTFGNEGLAVIDLRATEVPARPITLDFWKRAGSPLPEPVTELIHSVIYHAELAFDSQNNIVMAIELDIDLRGRNELGRRGEMLGIEFYGLTSEGTQNNAFGSGGFLFVPFESGATGLIRGAIFSTDDQLYLLGPIVERNFHIDYEFEEFTYGVAAKDSILRLDGPRLVVDDSFVFPDVIDSNVQANSTER